MNVLVAAVLTTCMWLLVPANPSPVAALVSPPVVVAGNAGFWLTVRGSGFSRESVVRVDGQDRATALLSPTAVAATIPASDIRVAGDRAITVFTPPPGGGTSSSVMLRVSAAPPAPALTAVTPESVQAGGPDFVLTANGTNFTSDSLIEIDGETRPTISVSSTTLTTSMTNDERARPGTRRVRVVTPPPGGGASDAKTLTIGREPQPSFKAGIEVVTVPIVVTGRDRAPIGNLSLDDFRLREDGIVQSISTVAHERRPVSLVIVLDSSGSMREDQRRSLAINTARQIMAALEPGDEAALVLFTQKPELLLPMTGVDKLPPLNWDTWQPDGWSSVLDAFQFGAGLLDSARNPNRVVLLISDGFENSSNASPHEVARSFRQSEVTAYAIAVGVPMARRRPMGDVADTAAAAVPSLAQPPMMATDDALQRLVEHSGGFFHRALNPTAVTDAVRHIASDWRNHYTLTYSPAKAFDGKYRRIRVDVARRGVDVRHRGGYLAAPLK